MSEISQIMFSDGEAAQTGGPGLRRRLHEKYMESSVSK